MPNPNSNSDTEPLEPTSPTMSDANSNDSTESDSQPSWVAGAHALPVSQPSGNAGAHALPTFPKAPQHVHTGASNPQPMFDSHDYVCGDKFVIVHNHFGTNGTVNVVHTHHHFHHVPSNRPQVESCGDNVPKSDPNAGSRGTTNQHESGVQGWPTLRRMNAHIDTLDRDRDTPDRETGGSAGKSQL